MKKNVLNFSKIQLTRNKKVKTTKRKVYICGYCYKYNNLSYPKFKYKRHLSRHMKSHRNKKRVYNEKVCKPCQRSFKLNVYLKHVTTQKHLKKRNHYFLKLTQQINKKTQLNQLQNIFTVLLWNLKAKLQQGANPFINLIHKNNEQKVCNQHIKIDFLTLRKGFEKYQISKKQQNIVKNGLQLNESLVNMFLFWITPYSLHFSRQVFQSTFFLILQPCLQPQKLWENNAQQYKACFKRRIQSVDQNIFKNLKNKKHQAQFLIPAYFHNHWSLLYLKNTQTQWLCFHIDSYYSGDSPIEFVLKTLIYHLFSQQVKFQNTLFPIQSNLVDCGYIMLINSFILLHSKDSFANIKQFNNQLDLYSSELVSTFKKCFKKICTSLIQNDDQHAQKKFTQLVNTLSYYKFVKSKKLSQIEIKNNKEANEKIVQKQNTKNK